MNSHLVWMDLEMTGLDPNHDVIIEIATIITDSELDVVAQGPVMAVAQPETILATMDDWNVKHHSQSGLIERVRRSTISPTEAEATTLAFITEHVDANSAPLCGNTIWQDRRFLARYMPTLEAYLHYRIIDVSSIKELARRWRPKLLQGLVKKNEHTALADIRESIMELAYYREHFFQPASKDDDANEPDA